MPTPERKSGSRAGEWLRTWRIPHSPPGECGNGHGCTHSRAGRGLRPCACTNSPGGEWRGDAVSVISLPRNGFSRAGCAITQRGNAETAAGVGITWKMARFPRPWEAIQAVELNIRLRRSMSSCKGRVTVSWPLRLFNKKTPVALSGRGSGRWTEDGGADYASSVFSFASSCSSFGSKA